MSNIITRALELVEERVANLERKPSRKERQMTLIKIEHEGFIPDMHVMHGNGEHVIYWPKSTYGATLNWMVLTPNFPRPYAPIELWDKLTEMFLSVYEVTWEHREKGHAPIPTYTLKNA